MFDGPVVMTAVVVPPPCFITSSLDRGRTIIPLPSAVGSIVLKSLVPSFQVTVLSSPMLIFDSWPPNWLAVALSLPHAPWSLGTWTTVKSVLVSSCYRGGPDGLFNFLISLLLSFRKWLGWPLFLCWSQVSCWYLGPSLARQPLMAPSEFSLPDHGMTFRSLVGLVDVYEGGDDGAKENVPTHQQQLGIP